MNTVSARHWAIGLLASTLSAACGEAATPVNAGAGGASGGTATGGSSLGGAATGVGGNLTAMGGASTGVGGVGGSAASGQGGDGTAAGGTAGSTGAVGGSGGAGAGTGVGGSAGAAVGAGGSGGPGGGGTAGAGGTVGPSSDPDPSAGCGMAAPPACTPCQANGLDYYVDMPAGYDPMRAYPVVFQYHPLGGSGQGARTMYRVRPEFPDAIYVSPDGSDNGFPNSGGVDEAVTREIMDTIEASLCVDRARYFATGFSYGGSMSYTAACNMSDKFRAVAAMAGAPISGAACTREEPERPVAVLGIHGEEDTALPITMAEPIIQTWLQKNGCSEETQPSLITGSDCATSLSALATGEYQGCMEGYPVIWCPIPGYPHNIPMWSGSAIAEFFQQF